MNHAQKITNLLAQYGEFMDTGDLEGAARLFSRAKIRVGGGETVSGTEPMLALWRAHVRIYPCGTPRTKHVFTNHIVDVDEEAGAATCRTYYTVFQQTEELPLQAICAGRYHDEFACENGEWHFTARDYSMLDLVGDVSHHLLIPVSGQSGS